MKIQYASDLPLEFECNSDFIEKNPLIVTGEYINISWGFRSIRFKKLY